MKDYLELLARKDLQDQIKALRHERSSWRNDPKLALYRDAVHNAPAITVDLNPTTSRRFPLIPIPSGMTTLGVPSFAPWKPLFLGRRVHSHFLV